MANDKKQLKKTKRRRAVKPKNEKKPSRKPARKKAKEAPTEDLPEPVSEASAVTSDSDEPEVDGAKEFRKYANRVVVAHADKIAQTLGENAEKGSITCAKLLYELSKDAKSEVKLSTKDLTTWINGLEDGSRCEESDLDANPATREKQS